mmetsp:Transcript_2174/g.6450  ORF Transcript_2174/g.6450 Transcript_2174/m.6450 type:complete len:231 (-) Transcript_2174:706-1398(-)
MTTLSAASSCTFARSGPGAHRDRNADPPSSAATPTKTRLPHSVSSFFTTYRAAASGSDDDDSLKFKEERLHPSATCWSVASASAALRSPDTHGSGDAFDEKSNVRSSFKSCNTGLRRPSRAPRGLSANLTSSKSSFCGAASKRPKLVWSGANTAARRAARAAAAPSRSSDAYSRDSLDTAALTRSKSSTLASRTAIRASSGPKPRFSPSSFATTKNKSEVPAPARPTPAP